MDTSILKLADKERSYFSERFFQSKKNDTVLYAHANMRWCECGKTEFGLEGVSWDLMCPVCANTPFGGWVVLKTDLAREEVVDWFKEHILEA